MSTRIGLIATLVFLAASYNAAAESTSISPVLQTPPDPALCALSSADQGIAIQPPAPPGTYLDPTTGLTCLDSADVPENASPQCVRVSSTAELVDEARRTNPIRIVLADGVYGIEDLDAPLAALPNLVENVGVNDAEILSEFRFLRLSAAHHLWSEHPGGAVLRFGIDFGGNAPAFDPARFAMPELHGVIIAVRNRRNGVVNTTNPYQGDDDDLSGVDDPAIRTSAISIWGSARDAIIEDVRVEGAAVVDYGLDAVQSRAADGLELRRAVFRDFSSIAVRTQFCQKNEGEAFCNDATVDTRMVIEDLVVRQVGTSFDPSDLTLSDQVGVVLGAPARVERVRIADVSRVGIVTQGSMRDGRLRDVEIDRIGLPPANPNAPDPLVCGRGIYFENRTVDTRVHRFCIGSNVQIGINSEWDCAGENCFARGIRNRVRNGLVDASFIGAHFDQGTVRPRVGDVIFRNARRAGIIFHNNVEAPLAQAELVNTFMLPASAETVSTAHWNASNETGLCAFTDDLSP